MSWSRAHLKRAVGLFVPQFLFYESLPLVSGRQRWWEAFNCWPLTTSEGGCCCSCVMRLGRSGWSLSLSNCRFCCVPSFSFTLNFYCLMVNRLIYFSRLDYNWLHVFCYLWSWWYWFYHLCVTVYALLFVYLNYYVSLPPHSWSVIKDFCFLYCTSFLYLQQFCDLDECWLPHSYRHSKDHCNALISHLRRSLFWYILMLCV